MPLMHDPDEDAEAPEPGALPLAQQPRGRAWLKRYIRRNWAMLATMACVMGLLLGLGVFLAIHAARMPLAPVKTYEIPISAGQRSTPANDTPVPNAVRFDAAGNPVTQAPPGMSPAEYQQFLMWRANCPNGQCQQRQTPADSAAQKRRDEYEKLMEKVRSTAPDAGNHNRAAQGVPAAQKATAPALETKPPAGEPASTGNPSGLPPGQTDQYCDANVGEKQILMGGLTPIKARLITGITGEAKGPMIAQVVQPAYNWDMTEVLVPKGSFLNGNYGRVAEQDQERILILTDTLTLPNGCRIRFPEAIVEDQTGQVGIRDQVNHHYAQIFLTAIGISAIGAASEATAGGSYTYSPVDILRIGFGTGASNAAQQVFSRFAHRLPTLTIRPGIEIVVFPPTDVALPPWRDHHAQ